MQRPSFLKIGVLGCLIASAAPASAQVSFDFSYTGTGGFLDGTNGPARQAALQQAASALGSYFISGSAVTITFSVDSYSVDNDTLASAGSSIYSYVGETGFFQNVVQKKIITGADDNAAGADGMVNWNWNNNWGAGLTVSGSEFDMRNAATHELLHAMGLTSRLTAPGTNSGTTVWSVFDRFLVNGSGASLINSAGVWQGLDSALVDGNLYFNGANAVAANGGNPVPLYAPESWEQGSSGIHVDSSLGIMVMNAAVGTGEGVRTLSAIELGMLRDIGYNVIPEPGSALLLLSGATIFLRRRRETRVA